MYGKQATIEWLPTEPCCLFLEMAMKRLCHVQNLGLHAHLSPSGPHPSCSSCIFPSHPSGTWHPRVPPIIKAREHMQGWSMAYWNYASYNNFSHSFQLWRLSIVLYRVWLSARQLTSPSRDHRNCKPSMISSDKVSILTQMPSKSGVFTISTQYLVNKNLLILHCAHRVSFDVNQGQNGMLDVCALLVMLVPNRPNSGSTSVM